MTEALFLAIAVSVDTYLVSAAYSNSSIKIPWISGIIISAVCAAILGISLKFSELIGVLLPQDICRTGGMIILISIGIITIFKSLIRELLRRLSDGQELSLKMSGLGLGISIYLDDTAADIDKSKSLSAGEASALALASSLDSAATGLGCGFSGINALTVSIMTFFAGAAAILLGMLTGKKISSLNHDFSWAGGVILIIFAIASYIL